MSSDIGRSSAAESLQRGVSKSISPVSDKSSRGTDAPEALSLCSASVQSGLTLSLLACPASGRFSSSRLSIASSPLCNARGVVRLYTKVLASHEPKTSQKYATYQQPVCCRSFILARRYSSRSVCRGLNWSCYEFIPTRTVSSIRCR